MIAKWLDRKLWRPFESMCHRFPLLPLASSIEVVAPGIELIRINNFVTRWLSRFGGGFDYAVVYVVDRELVFDTGFSWAARSLRFLIFELGIHESLRFIVNSHAHEDHTGNNGLFRALCPQARIFAHPDSLREIAYPSQRRWYRRFLFGPESAQLAEPVQGKFVTRSGRMLEVLSTPGHTPGHICLYDPKNHILFSGDLFIAPDLDTQLEGADGPDWIESLRCVLDLRVDLVLDAHGVVLRGEACRSQLSAKLEFLESLQKRVIELAQKGPISQEALVSELFREKGWVNTLSLSEGWMALITGDDFSRTHLVRSFLRKALK